MSYRRTAVHSFRTAPISAFQYRQMVAADAPEAVPDRTVEETREAAMRLSEELLAKRLIEARAAGASEAEVRLRQEYEHRATRERTKVMEAIHDFDRARREYFGKAESEVVQLALAIARKILHREAQVEPMLVAAIVQIALRQLKDGTAVSIRLRPEEAPEWRDHVAGAVNNVAVTVVADTELQPGDCVMETDLGSVNFSLDAQLKEIEQGFLDVLAQKPRI